MRQTGTAYRLRKERGGVRKEAGGDDKGVEERSGCVVKEKASDFPEAF